MKEFKWLTILILCTACAASALTPSEKDAVHRARVYIQQAQALEQQQSALLQQDAQDLNQLDQLATQQANEIGVLQSQIATAHKHEEELAAYEQRTKPIMDQINKFWGLGAFAYGFKVLARHLFILLGVLALLAVAIFVLSFFFPFITPAIRAIGSFFALIFQKIKDILDRIRK